ncbi:unnamed protein product [Rotaria sp. Silwood2]|nr:unnamed protein product [Rotaria sp. Silwood2]
MTNTTVIIDDYASGRDHTLNNITGSFIHVNALGQLPNRLRAPYDHTTRSQYDHYYLLRINSTIPRGTVATLKLSRFNNRSWIAILNQTTGIVIGVTTGADCDAIMALDYITYTPQCVKYNETIPTRPTTTTTLCTGSSTTTTRYTGTTTTITTTKYTGPSTTTTTVRATTTTRSVVCAQYCYKGGTCEPPTTELGKPKCERPPSFTGARCENKEKPSKKSNLGAILGGIFGGLAVIALIICWI